MSIVNVVSSVGGSAVITLPAVANTFYAINRIIASYSSNISIGAGSIQIKLGSTVIFGIDMAGNLADYIINGGITSGVNETVTITLSGIALATGQINAIYETYTV